MGQTKFEGSVQTGTRRQVPIGVLEPLDVIVKDEQSRALEHWYYVVLGSDGTEVARGQLDATGKAHVESLPRGTYKVTVTEDDPNRAVTPLPAAVIPPATRPPVGEGRAARLRRGKADSSSEA